MQFLHSSQKAKEILNTQVYHREKNKGICQMGPSLPFSEVENEHVAQEQELLLSKVIPQLSENNQLIQLRIVQIGESEGRRPRPVTEIFSTCISNSQILTSVGAITPVSFHNQTKLRHDAKILTRTHQH